MKNKLLVLLPVLALSSCSGFSITREDALAIIKNIEADIASYKGVTYTMNNIRKTKDSEEKTLSVYEKEKMFFHTYTISTTNTNNENETIGRVSESWKFVMPYTSNDANGKEQTKDYIFDVSRIINQSSLEQEISKQYVVSYELYSAEAWAKASKEYEDSLLRRMSDALEHSTNLINNQSAKLDLKSFNAYSLHLYHDEGKESETLQDSSYELDIYNAQLTSIKNVTGESKVETTFEYASQEIVYPTIKVTIV